MAIAKEISVVARGLAELGLNRKSTEEFQGSVTILCDNTVGDT